MNFDDYIFETDKDGFFIFKHKEDDGSPKYIYRGVRDLVKDETGSAETLNDIKILIEEYIAYHFSNGIATGYRRTSYPPPEDLYKHVAIGKYIYRDKADKLPKFMAIVRPYQNIDWPWGEAPTVKVEENTIALMKKGIDKAIADMPKKYKKFFE
ncbi:MAG: hypothetical protein OXF06_10355 [Bacteroidetes bacterium]|nr:hypothetical protein [Bacteroidota bacterium]MCY4225222.1 hypothetical protein [Bacteroidota bacterium]